MMTVNEFIEKLKFAARSKSLYVMGCYGAPMTETNKEKYIADYSYNKNREDIIRAADPDTFGFDGPGLIKGILWGWTGDLDKTYGGATYASNGVPDISEYGMINACPNASTDFTNIIAGEVVWMSGHLGIYIGSGQVIEVAPEWTDGVQYTWLGNLSQYKHDHYRIWTKHGRLPYVDYSAIDPSIGDDGYKVLNVSRYQASINYASAASSVNGAIVRCGYRGSLDGALSADSKASEHYNGFQNVTKVGFYFFSQAITEAEGIEEAEFVDSIISGWRCDFPVYVYSALSNSNRSGRADNLTKNERTAAILGFCNRIDQLGYRPGVYAEESWFTNNLDMSQLGGVSLWIIKNSSVKPSTETYDGWQYTDAGYISGISGTVNLSLFYNDIAHWQDDPIGSNNVNDFTLNVLVDEKTFNWEYQEPEFTLGNLTRSIDYSAYSTNNRDVGAIVCTIAGINRYTGTRTIDWTIVPKSIENLTMTLGDDGIYEYTGNPIIPTDIRVFDQDAGAKDLVENVDFELNIYNNVDVGECNIDAIGIGNFTDVLKHHFYIKAKAQDMNVFSLQKTDYDYTGYQICPVILNSAGLVEGRDYNVSYGQNIDATGTVTITCKGNYSGSKILTFTISKSATTYNVIDVSSYDEGTFNYPVAGSNIDGVIIRAGYRGYGSAGVLVKDSKLQAHYTGFNAFTKVGFYFTSQAINEGEAVAEAEYVYELIKTYKCDFPVYVQSEYGTSSETGRADGLAPNVRTSILLAFCNKLASMGYPAGVMAEDSWFANKLVASEISASIHSILVIKEGTAHPTGIDRYDGWVYTKAGTIVGYNLGIDKSYFYTDVAHWGGDSTKPDINDYEITTVGDTFEYTGNPIEPEVIAVGLIKDIDYRVAHSSNINAGTATTYITGINNYGGVKVIPWTITPTTIQNKEPILEYETIVYTGNVNKPSAEIEGLQQNVDFTLSYDNNINVGIANIYIKGIGNYAGVIKRVFTILARTSEALLQSFYLPYNEYKYTGMTVHPEVMCRDATLGLNVDYEVIYGTNTEVGTGTVTVILKGNYSGTTTLEFIISTMNIADRNITLSQYTYTYSGEPCKPQVHIDGDLIEGTNFEVVYFNNIDVGTAKAHVMGVGLYEGETDVEFTINKHSIEDKDAYIEEYSYYYNTQPITPRVYIRGVDINRDYRIVYTNNVDPGTATILINGVNNYSGTIRINFEILHTPISMCTAKYGEASVKTIYRIEDRRGLRIYTDYKETYQLVEGTDFRILDQYMEEKPDFHLYTFHVKGIGGFSEDIVYRFRVIDVEPPEPIDYEDDGVYNFGDIDEGDETAWGDYDFGDLEEGVDPESVADGDYDFDSLSGMLLDTYDDDNGKNIDGDGNDTDLPPVIIDDDDGLYNFGDIDEGDETAIGDYDFGDLSEGRDPDSAATQQDYDFNRMAGDIEDWLVPGTDFELVDTPIYPTFSSPLAFDTLNATYFVYNGEVKGGRVRVCRLDGNIALPAKSAGWCNTADLFALGVISVGDIVSVNGTVTEGPNGTGAKLIMEGNTMYVRQILSSADEGADFRPYGLANGPKSPVIGYAMGNMVRKVIPK